MRGGIGRHKFFLCRYGHFIKFLAKIVLVNWHHPHFFERRGDWHIWVFCASQAGQMKGCAHSWHQLPWSQHGPFYHLDHQVHFEEWSNFLCLGLMASLKIWNQTGVPADGMSNIGRTGARGVLAWHVVVDRGQRALEFWSDVIHRSIHSWLHDSSKCFTHKVYGTCIGIGSGRETREEASPNQLDSFGRGPPWLWCPFAQQSWPTGPLDSWPTLPFQGAAPTPADPWPG